MSKKINSYQVMAAMIRAFFEAFGCGVIDSNYPDSDFATRNNEKNIKQVMLDHYENISKVFFDVLFPFIARIQYEDVEQALNDANKEFADKGASILDYLRFACREQNFYDALVSEYQRNFGFLLKGQFSTIPEHIEGRIKGEAYAFIDEPTAINCLVRIVFSAYVAGLHNANKKQHIDQSTILRMLLINTQLMINDCPLKNTEADLIEQFLEACGSQDNLNVLVNTMNDMYRDLAEEDNNSDPNLN